MKDELKNFGVVILAAGQGKRLNCADLPKVLYKINDQPIISYILEELRRGGINKKQICLVVGFGSELVKEKIGPDYLYAMQNERLGTAHAALTGEEALPADFNNFLVINGDDSAFYKFNSLKELMVLHLANNNDISILTCEPDSPSGLGRVVRGDDGRVARVVEKENMTPELEKIKEINTNTFCFKRGWFKKHYKNLKLIAGLGEYGLPSFVGEALVSESKFSAVKLKDSREWFGVNTPEQLAEADKRKRENV
ncbi:MAG: sugar phosphate nucleotidyltransferase [bacterium]|nr:sugar phosphate nucleotidyltransferase [bacterium]